MRTSALLEGSSMVESTLGIITYFEWAFLRGIRLGLVHEGQTSERTNHSVLNLKIHTLPTKTQVYPAQIQHFSQVGNMCRHINGDFPLAVRLIRIVSNRGQDSVRVTHIFLRPGEQAGQPICPYTTAPG